jgi:hypothetical protein
MEDTITIPIEEYNQLVEDQRILDALHAGGVDNWEGYDEALSGFSDDED